MIDWSNKESILNALRRRTINSYDLYYEMDKVSDKLKDDDEFILEIIKYDERTIEYASERIRNNPNIMIEVIKNRETLNHAFKNSGTFERCIPTKLKDDATFMLEAIKKDIMNLQYASERLRSDKTFIMNITNSCDRYKFSEYFSYVSEELKNDKEVVYAAASTNPSTLEFASDELKNDKDFIMSLLKIEEFFSGRCFIYASDKLKDDEDVVRLAISLRGDNISYISPRLKENKVLLLSAESIPLEDIPESLKNDKDVILKAIETSRYIKSELILDKCLGDKEILLATVRTNPHILDALPNDIRNDREVILSAVSFEPEEAILYIPKEFIYDREVVLTALKAAEKRYYFPEEYELDNLPINLREDKEIIIALVNARGNHIRLESIPEKFKDDKDVARTHIKISPEEIRYLSDKLKHDKEFLLELIKEPNVLAAAKMHLKPAILEDIMHDVTVKKQTSEEYPLYLLNNITTSQEVFKQEQNDCVNYIRLLKEFNSYDIGSEEKGPILDKMKLSPCYKSYILGIGQYGKYEYEIISPEVKKIFKVCKELLELYTRESNKVIDFYIEDGYKIIKESLLQYLSKKDDISLYDRIICETLVSNILKQIQLLQIGILSKNDEKLNDTIELFEELLTSDLNQLKNYSISQKTETVDNKKHH